MSTETETPPSPVAELTRRLDEAVERRSEKEICDAVKSALQELCREHPGCLDEALLVPVESGYGRRLLHRDPAGRYTVVIMVWGEGQGTPIHDHSSMWCVECVYRGRIRVKSYRPLEVDGDRYRFELESEVDPGVGEAGALIPPFEYHVIENPFPGTAVTLHVYGGEMDRCGVYLPDPDRSGWHRRETRALRYSDQVDG